MNKLITKSLYLEYLKCPKNAWLKLHKPQINGCFDLSSKDQSKTQMGEDIERYAQQRFPKGVFQENFSLHKDVSRELFQTTFLFNSYLARTDIMQYDADTNQWNLIEVKSSTSKKDEHVKDTSFQAIVLKNYGIPLGRIFILHLNKEYVLDDQVDIHKMFMMIDITEEVKGREEETLFYMEKAQKDLLQEDEQKISCSCIYKGRSSQCETFSYSHPEVPSYSVHDITTIGVSKKKLATLIDHRIVKLDDIPVDFALNEKQSNQVNTYKKQLPMINYEAIEKELRILQYPLYFFDYETYAPAIPILKGFRPHEKMPIQFSLHVVYEEYSEPKHFEYLHESQSDPCLTITQKLHTYIGPTGTIIVWSKQFETGRNTELGIRHPEFKAFMENINKRTYDLRDIFAKQAYVHAGFKGSTSIKKILPILAPELSYKELEIQEGQNASQKWFEMVHGSKTVAEKQKIAQALRQYCGLDTYAMYKIWKYLRIICGSKPNHMPTHSKEQLCSSLNIP